MLPKKFMLNRHQFFHKNGHRTTLHKITRTYIIGAILIIISTVPGGICPFA